MKICFVSSSYPSTDGVGNTFVEQLVNAISLQGHDCTVISPYNTAKVKKKDLEIFKEYEIREVNGHKIHVYRPRFWSRNIPYIPISTNYYFASRAFEKIVYDKNLSFDCIYCHFFATALIAWHYVHKHKKPLFVATGESTISPHLQKPRFLFSWDKFKKDTNGIICVSTKNYKESVSLGYADETKCIVLPNGCNLNMFKPLGKDNCRKELGFSKDAFIVITVGEFSERKGQERVIKAIDSLASPHIFSIFIGKGNTLSKRDYILYQGQVAHNTLPLYLNASDVFVLPTKKEGCCNAIVEALACGLPVISSDSLFNKDILNNNNSILVNPEDVEGLSDAIRKIKSDSSMAISLSKGALMTASELSITKRAQRIISFIDESLA